MKPNFKSLVIGALVVAVAVMLLQFNADAVPESANSYKGLNPGTATLADVKAALGESPIKTAGGNELRYPSSGRPALNDLIYFQRGKLALVTSASPDVRYDTREKIVRQFGKPESQILFQTQQYLEYSEQGLRFICNAAGKTTGVLYFKPMRRRVPAGYPATRIDLRRELPEPKVTKAPSDFLVGAAQVSIAPSTFDKLIASKTERPHLAEDLFARVAVFQRGDTRVVFVGLDVFGMGEWDTKNLLKSLKKNGFEDVVIAMSHTHANVDTIGFYGYYPRAYAKYILKQTEAAVVKAAAAVKPIKSLQLGTAEMPLDGGRVVDLIRNGRDPGIVNPTVSIVQAIGGDGKPIVNLIHLACHPEVIRLNDTGGLSPDFVGTLCNDVSRELGGQTVFLNGALGGMLTPDTRARSQADAEAMGHALSKFFVQASASARPSSSYDVWRFRRPVQYPITGESILNFLNNPPEKIDFYQGRLRTEMNAVWIGDAQFITVPGELLPEIGFEIEAQMTGRVRAIVGLANGQMGYLIPSYDFRAGGYEERTGPGAGGGEITRTVGLELAPLQPPSRR